MDSEYCDAVTLIAEDAIAEYHAQNPAYESQWQKTDIDEFVGLVRTKMNMYCNLVKNKETDEKIAHHAMDMFNWITMLCIRGLIRDES